MTDLSTLPPGISNTEITNIRLVDNAKLGKITVFYQLEGEGHEGLYHAVMALVTTFTGDGTLGYRIFSVWVSLLTLAMTYTLARHLYNPTVALLSLSLLAVMMTPILLARHISPDAMVPFLVVGVTVALARSLPIYRTTRIVTSNTISFAVLGIAWGISFYVHSTSLLIILASMIFIVYLLFARERMSSRRRSYTGFAILVMLIIAMPYLISSINLPEYAAGQRVIGAYTSGLVRSIISGFLGIVIQGDINPAHNLIGRPLADIFSGLFMLVGFAVSVRRYRQPRYTLVVIMFIVLTPAAFVVKDSPNFLKFGAILPQLVIFFGVGVYTVFKLPIFQDTVFRWMAIFGIFALLGFNLLWTWQDFFVVWRNDEKVLESVNGDLGRIAHHLDLTGGDIPTILCNPRWGDPTLQTTLNRAETMILMMNRSQFDYREADCARSLIFANAGTEEQLVLIEERKESLHPYLQSWLDSGTFVTENVPREAIIRMDVTQLLADRAGAFITTSPVAYAPEAVGALMPVPPPIRLGGNVTFLGYEPSVQRVFNPGEKIDVITYWRVEGMTPSDLTFFTHILSDPVTLTANHDIISVNPRLLQERDVFVQITQIELSELALPGEYFVSMGAYERTSDNRLPVFLDNQPHGDRLFLYSIEVLEQESSD